jgi:hypothetical protein
MLLQSSPESEKPVAVDAPVSIDALSETIDQPIDVVQIVAHYLSILISWLKISIKFVFIINFSIKFLASKVVSAETTFLKV